jgi:hypothetical protein
MLQAQLRDRTYFSNEAFNEANTFGWLFRRSCG